MPRPSRNLTQLPPNPFTSTFSTHRLRPGSRFYAESLRLSVKLSPNSLQQRVNFGQLLPTAAAAGMAACPTRCARSGRRRRRRCRSQSGIPRVPEFIGRSLALSLRRTESDSEVESAESETNGQREEKHSNRGKEGVRYCPLLPALPP